MTNEVYLIDVTNKSEDNIPQKIQTLYETTQFNDRIQKNDNIAIKTQFIESHDTTYIKPEYIEPIIESIKEKEASPFLTDTNTLFNGKRSNTDKHLEAANEKGFFDLNIPLIIANNTPADEKEVKISKAVFDKVKVAKEIYDSDAMIVISHITGHTLTGYSGAIKNTGSGCATRNGKIEQHKLAAPFISRIACLACNVCIDLCPEEAITVDSIAHIDYDKCIGCNNCISDCPTDAIKLNKIKSEEYMKAVTEYAYGAIENKKDKTLYINILLNINPDSDCNSYDQNPIVDDIGILASYNPVAIDQASYDLINKQEGNENSMLKNNHDPEKDKFKGLWRNIDSYFQFDYGDEIGLGSKKYNLIKI
jgi:uncharacterized Fe-S center protein